MRSRIHLALIEMVFLVFMFPAAASAPAKLDRIFTKAADRAQVHRVITAIGHSMTAYFWVQTLVSLLISALALVTMVAIGLPNALYWAVLIFFLNFIPIIGAGIAVALPTLFAALQLDNPALVAATAFGLSFWPLIIGNFIQPNMTGKSVNLSPLVVLIALGFWATLWGLVGAFLAIPLTVMIMIVLAQFSQTRPLAILMSGNAEPLGVEAAAGPLARADATAPA